MKTEKEIKKKLKWVDKQYWKTYNKMRGKEPVSEIRIAFQYWAGSQDALDWVIEG